MSFAVTRMDLEIIRLSEVRQRQIYDITHMWNLIFKKMIQMNLFTKQKQTYRYPKQTYGYQRGNMAGRDKSGAWDEHTPTTYIR